MGIVKSLTQFLSGLLIFYYGVNLYDIEVAIGNEYLTFLIGVVIWISYYVLLGLGDYYEK